MRALDSKTRITTTTRFNYKFFRVFSTNRLKTPRKASLHFFDQKIALLCLLKEVTPSPERKMLKLLVTCFRHHDIVAKTLSRMTTAITFSGQNDAIVSESKGLTRLIRHSTLDCNSAFLFLQHRQAKLLIRGPGDKHICLPDAAGALTSSCQNKLINFAATQHTANDPYHFQGILC